MEIKLHHLLWCFKSKHLDFFWKKETKNALIFLRIESTRPFSLPISIIYIHLSVITKWHIELFGNVLLFQEGEGKRLQCGGSGTQYLLKVVLAFFFLEEMLTVYM